MDDAQVLRDYFHASRYVTRYVFSKYGMDPANYESNIENERMRKLKDRLRSLLMNDFRQPSTGEDLRHMLGEEFNWVKSSMDF